MSNIPTQLENPKGLHQRYKISKIIVSDKIVNAIGAYSKRQQGGQYLTTVPTDEGAEYFVLRLDEGGKDPEHIKACRVGINAYADAIQHHLPELAKDLRERYPLLP